MLRRIVGVLPVLILAAAGISAAGGPSIGFDKETHDYGRVLYGDIVTEEFVFTNTGDQPLTIENLEASCGCTKAVKGSSEVQPNSKSKIVASFDTDGLRAGKTKKTITVHSNDPAKPTVELTLLADVVRQINVDPPRLVTKLTDFREDLTLPVRISNSSDKPVNVQVLGSQSENGVPASEGKMILVKPRSVVPFTVVLKIKNEPGRTYWAGKVMMKTDHPKEKEIEVPYAVKLDEPGQTSALPASSDK